MELQSDYDKTLQFKSVAKIIQFGYNQSIERSELMPVTATELKNNIGKYLVLSEDAVTEKTAAKARKNKQQSPKKIHRNAT